MSTTKERLDLLSRWLDDLEGRGTTNHKEDRGALTRRGMIQSDADRYCDWKGIPRRSVMDLTEDQLEEVRVVVYFIPLGCAVLPEPLDWLLYQWGLLQEGAAPKGLQRAVGVSPDGNIGPVTVKAVEACGAKTVSSLLLDNQVSSCRGVVERSNERVATWLKSLEGGAQNSKPQDQRAFALGWVNRCTKAASLCGLDWKPLPQELAWAEAQTADYKGGKPPKLA